AMGAKSVLIKGGHSNNNDSPLDGESSVARWGENQPKAPNFPYSQDYWTNGKISFWLAGKRQQGKAYHGAGCTLSAAIAANLALGYPLPEALVIAKMYVTQGICLAKPQGAGPAHVAHQSQPWNPEHLPQLTLAPIMFPPQPFLSCGEKPLGL